MRKCFVCFVQIPTYAASKTSFEKKGLCGLDCTVLACLNRIEKSAELRRNEERKFAVKVTKRKDNSKDLAHQKEITQKVFNNFIRAIDEGLPCISCGKMKCGFGVDAGHYHSVGSHPELRYEPRNCHAQGNGCNRSNHKANYKRRVNAETVNKGYQQGIVNRYGIELLNWLDGPHEAKHYTIDDLKRMRKEFSAEIRHIKDNGKASRDWRAIQPQFSEQR